MSFVVTASPLEPTYVDSNRRAPTIHPMNGSVSDLLNQIASEYPVGLRDAASQDVRRQTFHVTTVSQLAPGGSVADIGGGLGLFSVGCAAVGLNATLIDDFADPVNVLHGDSALKIHQEFGVTILRRDVIREGLQLDAHSMDVITSFDSMEHWHNSPKAVFAEVMTALKPGGWFLLGVPNCVNLRKRITVVLGKAKWSSMADWYEEPVFRGHVREADVDDLLYIARDMDLTDVKILGRNWIGYVSRYRWASTVTPSGRLCSPNSPRPLFRSLPARTESWIAESPESHP